MPEIASNVLTIKARLKGERAVYQIKGVPGLHLAVLGDGRGSWRLRYRPRRGAGQRWHTIGDAQTIELGDAITKARELLAGLQLQGVDPHAAADKEAAAKLTFADVYKEWLDNPGRKRTLRDRTREEYERIFKSHVEPRIGKTKIALLDKATIKTKLEEIRKATTDLELGHRGLQSSKALGLIRAVCRYALLQEYCDRDPTFGIDRPVPDENPNGKRHRPPTNDELKKLWNGSEGMQPKTRRAFRLTILLGKRVGEIVGARKTEVELGDEASLFIPGAREGNKSREDQRVPLPPLAQKLIEEAIADSGESPFLFPGDVGMRNKRAKGSDAEIHMNRSTPSDALRRLKADLGIAENVRLHDMRGLLTDRLAEMRVPQEYRSHVLHHTGDMKATLASRSYTTWDFADEKRRALELWERRLIEIVEGRKPSSLRWDRDDNG